MTHHAATHPTTAPIPSIPRHYQPPQETGQALLIPVSAPLTFKLLYKEPRQRNYRQREETAALTLRVRAVSEEDAPTVWVTTEPFTDTETMDIPTRHWNGELYTLATHETRNHAGQKTLYAPAKLEHLLQRRYTDVEAHSAAEAAAQFQKKLDEKNVIYIGGQPYEQRQEQIIAVHREEWPSLELVSVDASGVIEDRSHYACEYFRLDQRDAASRYYQQRLLEPRRRGRNTHVTTRQEAYQSSLKTMRKVPRVLRPELLRFGQLRPFTMKVQIKGSLNVTVHSTNARHAARLAHDEGEKIAGRLLTAGRVDSYVRQEDLLLPPDPATETAKIHLSTADLKAVCITQGTHLLLTNHQDLSRTYPTRLRGLPLLNAAALLLTLPSSVPMTPEERITPLLDASEFAAPRLETLLGSGGVNFAQRAARGQLPLDLHGRLVSAIDALCADHAPPSVHHG